MSSLFDLCRTIVFIVYDWFSDRKKKRPCLFSKFQSISINQYLEIRENYTTVLISGDELTKNPAIDLSEAFDMAYQSTQKAFCKIEISNVKPNTCIMDFSVSINNCIAFSHRSLNYGDSFVYLLCFDMSIFNKYILKKPQMIKRYMIEYIYNGINEEKLEQHTILNLNTCNFEPEIELVGKQISSQKTIRFWSKG